MDDEYWRGYDAAKLQGAAAENELRQKLERLTAERDEALGRADKLRGHLEAALRRWRTWRERARQAEAENDRLKAALEEHEQSFALYDDACRRGTALWRAADPEHRQMVLPDTAALVAWLLERLGERDLALGQIAADLKASWYGCTGPRAAGQDERLVAERLAAYENALAIVETARAALRGEGREGTGRTDNCYQCQCPDGPGREGAR